IIFRLWRRRRGSAGRSAVICPGNGSTRPGDETAVTARGHSADSDTKVTFLPRIGPGANPVSVPPPARPRKSPAAPSGQLTPPSNTPYTQLQSLDWIARPALHA